MHIAWPGFSEKNTLVIPVDKREFPILQSPLLLGGRTFKPKQETHVTVFGSSVGTALLQRIKTNPDIRSHIIKAFENTDWSFTQTSDYRHLVRKDAAGSAKETIIVLLEMAGMARFYQELKALGLIGADHPLPPPHVTLYTRNCDSGIGIHSDDELAKLTFERLTRILHENTHKST